MRIEAQSGPVVLLFEREAHPRAGETFKVAVFVGDRAMGTAKVAYEAWSEFCQAATQMRSSP